MWEAEMILPYSIVNSLTVIQVPRRLPREGTLVVGTGESVEATQLVGHTRLPGDFCIIDVARELGVSPRKAKAYIKVKIGQRVREGAVLASRGRIGGQQCVAPIDGTVTGYGFGRMLLEAPHRRYQLNALIAGTIARVWPDEGVLVETTGALLQGAWGNGQEGHGTLKMAVRTARRTLRARQIDASAQGTILVGGSQVDEEALELAIEMRVRGIIVGGVPIELIPRLQAIELPVVATEGIGKIPMSRAAFKLLQSLEGRRAALSGHLTLRWGSERPFVAVPIPSRSGNPIQPKSHLTIGDRVLGLRGEYLGVSGTVMEIPRGNTMLETGAKISGAYVKFDGSKESVFVPFLNLERLL
jgi:hypothetical protein